MRRRRGRKWVRLAKRIASHAVLIVAVLFALFPVYFIAITSFSKIPIASITAQVLIPKMSQLTLASYHAALYGQYPTFGMLLENSLIFAGSAAAIGMALAAFTGFALSKFNFPGRRSFVYFILIISLFPSFLLIIPYYFMFAKLGLIDSYPGLIIPYSAGAVVFSGILVKNYMDSIPDDIEEAALVDGLGRTGAFFRVLLPLCYPVLGLAAFLAFVGPYTDYALAHVFITSSGKETLALNLYSIATTDTGASNYGVVTAFAIVMSLPIVVFYIAFQRYIIGGLTLGAVRG
ncbi:MAG TPA: ABC transporter permease subunit [Thermoplasmata archaeon]|jgi:arabinogalactan oligomer / maltooligosaccharide transport system permease protein|nr:ABC transporter permease subunit [Thermoplasmata archaeon]